MKPTKGLYPFLVAMLLAGLALAIQPVAPAHADDTITVTSNADGTIAALSGNGTCDLREAIQAANTNASVNECLHNGTAGTDTINFAANYTVTLTGASGEDFNASGDLDIRDNLIINGTGTGLTIIDGGGNDRVFHIDPATTGITVEINNLTVQNGNTTFAGGILNDDNAILTLTNVTVSGNTANTFHGGGIWNDDNATLTINSSTISGNTSSNLNGGGIYNENAVLTINNSTIGPNNSAPNGNGGGIFNATATLIINNSTISGNSAINGGAINSGGGNVTLNDSTVTNNSTPPVNAALRLFAAAATLSNTIVADQAAGRDCSAGGGGTITSNGYNLDSDGTCGLGATGDQTNPPLLGPLADNGGPTQTHALLAGSLAIDTGDPGCPATDQRGETRPLDGNGDTVAACDTGAYEAPGPPTITKVFAPDTIGVNGVSTLTFTIVNPSALTPLTGVAFDDNLPPPDVVIATPPNVVNTCGGAVTAAAGTGLIQLTGGTLAAGGTCNLSVDVTSAVVGVYVNTSDPITSNETVDGGTATDTLTVGARAGRGRAGAVSAATPTPTPTPIPAPPSISTPYPGLVPAPTPTAIPIAIVPGLPKTGAPPGLSGLAGITVGLVTALGMISGGVMLRRRMD